MDEKARVDEVIDELLERMKEPGMAKQAFDDLARRIRILQNLVRR